MDKLIPVMNNLLEVFERTSTSPDMIELPQIVAIGSQSSGKSSVLESLIGRSFLPRGTGIVTRCPIILQLNYTQSTTPDEDNDWHCKLDNDNTKLTDCDEIRRLIEQRMDILSKNVEKGITSTPIFVKVFSSKVIPLTIVDLPGIVKNPIGGQPKDIETVVENLIFERIRNPNAIILAVTPANTDIATSESIKMAARVDPKKERTLSVLTKLDLMDKGTDAKKVLSGEVIPMKLGIIGVVNRSQEDSNNNKSLEDARRSEQEFFQVHYPNEKNVNGTNYLAHKLNSLLKRHIQTFLLTITDKINSMIMENESKLEDFGDAIPKDEKLKQRALDDNIEKFIQRFITSARERPHNWDMRIPPPKNENGIHFAQQIVSINDRLNNELIICLGQNIEKAKIKDAIMNFSNIEGTTSIPNAIRSLVQELIVSLEDKCLSAAEKVHKVLGDIVQYCLKSLHLKKLNSEIARVSRDILDEQLKVTKTSIKHYIKIQTSMLYSNAHTYRRLLKTKLNDNEESQTESNDSSSDINNTESDGETLWSPPFPLTHSDDTDIQAHIRKILSEYCSTIQKEIGNFTPKQIIYYLHDMSIKIMKDRIHEATTGKANELVCESEEIVLRRTEIENTIQNLLTADQIIKSLESSD